MSITVSLVSGSSQASVTPSFFKLKPKVTMWQKIKNMIDRIFPVVEVHDEIKCEIGKEEFTELMEKLISQYEFSAKTAEPTRYVMKVPGKIVGDLPQVKSIWREPKAHQYKNMNSTLLFLLTNSGSIKITSYELVLGLKKEQKVFSEILEQRLDAVKKILESNLG